MRLPTEDLTPCMRFPPLGEACHRELEAATWATFVLTYYRHAGSATLYSHLLNNFSFSLYKKTTKSWLIISNPFHPIMIQWIIYFPQLNHSRSHFLSCRQKPVYFTHGSQLVFIETFKMHLNTEGLRRAASSSLVNFVMAPFCPRVFRMFVLKEEKRVHTAIVLCHWARRFGVSFGSWCLFWIHLHPFFFLTSSCPFMYMCVIFQPREILANKRNLHFSICLCPTHNLFTNT